MNNNTSLKIVIAETSVIIRSGLTAVLKRIPNLNAHPIEVSSPESLQNYIHMHPADIIIINPTFGGWFDLPAFKAEHGKSGIKYIAMVCSVIDNNILKEYDENFAMCDDIDVITSKINHLLHTEEEEEKDSEQETLSHHTYGNTYQYYAVVSEEDFRKRTLKNVISKYFNNSYLSAVSSLVKEEDISLEELKQLIQDVEKGRD